MWWSGIFARSDGLMAMPIVPLEVTLPTSDGGAPIDRSLMVRLCMDGGSFLVMLIVRSSPLPVFSRLICLARLELGLRPVGSSTLPMFLVRRADLALRACAISSSL